MDKGEALKDISEEEQRLLSYYNEVKLYLSAFGIEKELIEDAVQDTFIEALINLHKLRDRDKMKFWLLKIAKHTGIKYIKARKKIVSAEISFDDSLDNGGANKEDYDNIIRKEIAEADRRRLYSCLEKLSQRERKALILYYGYGHKLSEIARLMGENLNNVKSISRRAKQKLRKMLESEEGGGEDED